MNDGTHRSRRAAMCAATGSCARSPHWSRRRLLGAALGLGAGLWVSGRRDAFAADAPVGLIALPRGREIGLVQPDGVELRTIVNLALGEFIADVALSPDRSKVA